MFSQSKTSIKYGTFCNSVKSNTQQFDKIIAEYVWIDGTGINIRSKSRTLNHNVSVLEDIPEWNYDGSSCEQSTTSNSEVILKPAAYFPDPFRGGDNILVLCSSYSLTGDSFDQEDPANSNFRHFWVNLLEGVDSLEPWFGVKQQYTLFEKITYFHKQPLGWPIGGFPAKEGPYYWGVGQDNCFGRTIADRHYKACLAANISTEGTNSGVMPGSWEFSIGPCKGVEVADHLWMARYILWRITEDLGVGLNFETKPIKGKWTGAKSRYMLSTEEMRQEGGLEHVHRAVSMLRGETDEDSTSGDDQSPWNEVKSLVVIPSLTKLNGRGHLEDKRYNADADPYYVTSCMISDIFLKDGESSDIRNRYKSWSKAKKMLDY